MKELHRGLILKLPARDSFLNWYMDHPRFHLIAQELLRAFGPSERMRAAGYQTVDEFFDRHGWHLSVREIREILDRETGQRPLP
jgi:hypothetical protein